MTTALRAITALLILPMLAVVWPEKADPQKLVDVPCLGQILTESAVIGNRDEPDELQLFAFSKRFCGALQKLNNGEIERDALRVFFDPLYLEAHDLKEGAFPVTTVAVRWVFDIQLANDRRTVVCEVETEENQKELLLLRLTVHDRRVYLTPHAPPDPTTRRFTPWIFRMEVTSPPVGRWTVEFANGVTEVCEIRTLDWSATVVEPGRTSNGRITVKDGSLLIVYDDDRVERLTPVGQRIIVEHWNPGAGLRSAPPVPGIATRSP